MAASIHLSMMRTRRPKGISMLETVTGVDGWLMSFRLVGLKREESGIFLRKRVECLGRTIDDDAL